MTEPSLPEGVELRLLPPTSLRIRTHQPEWEVGSIDAALAASCNGRSPRPAPPSTTPSVYHPRTGEPIPLESSTDLDDRVEKVADCWQNPDKHIHRSSWE